jgi:methylated-DNA-protein-cysteine methyltransferase-like protein
MKNKKEYSVSTQKILAAIKIIPSGKVDTYGNVADRAGLRNGARLVVRVLHTLSESEKLPWYRIVNKQGKISLEGEGAILQRNLLEIEGVIVNDDKIDLEKYGLK